MIENEEENVTGDKEKEEKITLKKEKSKDSIKKSSESTNRSESIDQGSPKKDASTDPIEESGEIIYYKFYLNSNSFCLFKMT